jgi:hypothetical protein
MVRKRTARKPQLFPRSAGARLRIQEDLLYTLALDLGVLRRTCHNNYTKLNLFIDEAQKAWAYSRHRVGCDACGRESFIRWLRGLIKESYEAKLWVPSGFIKRLRQLERGELVLGCQCGRDFTVPLHADLPVEFQQCAQFMGWKWTVVPTWDGKYLNLSSDPCGGDEDCPELVEAIVEAWRHRPSDDEMGNADLRDWIVNRVNKSAGRWTVWVIETLRY